VARSPLAEDARLHLEDAVVDALGGPEGERAIKRLLAGPMPDAVARALVEQGIVDRVLASPELQRALASPELQRALEEALAGPALRAALARQGMSVLELTLAALRRRLAALDDRLEGVAWRLLRRRQRVVEPPEPGIATRLVALGADLALAHVAFLLGVAVVALVGYLVGRPSAPLADALAAAGWVLAVGGYFVFFWSSVGRTPGMLLLHVRVRRDGPDAPPGFIRSCVRLVGLFLSISLVVVGFAPVLVDTRRRTLYDLISGTRVVRG